MILFQIDTFWVTMIPQNEIRRFGIRRNGTEPRRADGRTDLYDCTVNAV